MLPKTQKKKKKQQLCFHLRCKQTLLSLSRYSSLTCLLAVHQTFHFAPVSVCDFSFKFQTGPVLWSSGTAFVCAGLRVTL